MLPYIICGALAAAGLGLLRQNCLDHEVRRLRHGPWDHWTYRGRHIKRGQRVYIPETGETVKFTGRTVFIRGQSGHEERVTINGIAIRNGRACVRFTRH
jgi:hypothetical protein